MVNNDFLMGYGAGKAAGGGGGSTLITKTITENGTYAASSDNADGYSEVTVNVAGGGGASYTELSAVSMVNNSTNGYYNMLRLYANAGLRRIEFSFKNLVNVSSILVCSSAAGHGGSPGDPYISVSGVHGDASIISQQVVDGYTEINANISISSPRVINLGAWFGGSTYAGTNAFKYFRLYDADENLLYNLIPVLDNNNRPCFYDLVSKSFHYNDSMIEFVAGEAV